LRNNISATAITRLTPITRPSLASLGTTGVSAIADELRGREGARRDTISPQLFPHSCDKAAATGRKLPRYFVGGAAKAEGREDSFSLDISLYYE
jgi:hypothetical protein